MQANDGEASSLLKAADLQPRSRGTAGGGAAGSSTGGAGQAGGAAMALNLQDKDLWSKFEEHTNEMIVTKSGRFVELCRDPSLYCY